MATHSSDLAWRIPGMGEPGRLPSMGSHTVRHDWRDLAVAVAASLTCWSPITFTFSYLLRTFISNALSQFSSVSQSCPTLCDPMNRSTPGLPVHHQLLEFTQTHGHQVGDAIQPSHPLSSPSSPALNLSQHQGLFQWVSSLHQVAKVLEFQLQHQSFQWTPGLISFRMDWLDLFAVQGTLKSPLQHHSSKSSILRHSAFL